MKKTICILLIISLIAGISGCKKKANLSKSNTVSSNNSSSLSGNKNDNNNDSNKTDSSDVDDVFDSLNNKDDVISTDPNGFDNTKDTGIATPTPGENNQESDNNNQNQEDIEDISNSENSRIGTSSDLVFYNNDHFAYGITSDGDEVIGYYENGKIIDVLGGGGYFSFNNGSNMFAYNGVKKFTKTMIDGEICIIAYYSLIGSYANKTTVQTTYVFHENSITVTSEIATTSPDKDIVSGKFNRDYLKDVLKTDKRINYQWNYPSDGDYPYPEFESVVTKQEFDSNHLIYFFNRDNSNTYFYMNDYPDFEFPVKFEKSKGLSYKMEYDLVLNSNRTDTNPDYEALFKGKDSEIAVGIAPVKANDDNSTVFIDDKVDMNINVTNLTKEDVNFSLRYDVRDYYGNIVDSGIFINSTVFHNQDANRTIKITGGYGMYYINLYALSSLSKYYECYPLMLVKKHDFKYLSTSAFSIDALHRQNLSEENTSVSLVKKLGIHWVRVSAADSSLALAKKLKKAGSSTFAEYTGKLVSKKQLQNLLDTWNTWKDYADWFVMNNEFDSEVKGNLEKCRSRVKDYLLPNYFTFSKDFVKENNIPLCYVASCHGNSQWQQALHEFGVWEDSKIVDTHFYSNPKVPDKYGVTKNTMYSVEYGLQRMKDAFDSYGGTNDKFYAVGETGYSTSPNAKDNVDIRTQSDFNIRTGILCLSYGVDCISYYCMYDRTSYYIGTSDWQEMNFGTFYNYDYFGVVKPKPWAAGYANMTRQLDGVKTVSVNKKYDKDVQGTVRAFDINSKTGSKMIVAWSNIYTLPNTTSAGVAYGVARTPCLPWQSQWKKSENVEFDATATVVTVIDSMGNCKEYKSKNGKVTIPLTGSPVYITGVR